VVCHEEETAARLTGAGLAAPAVAIQSSHRFDCLQRFAVQIHADILLIYPEDAIFPDCLRARAMLDGHLQGRPDATFPEDYPPGFLPEILESAAMRKLASRGVAPGDAGNLLGLMEQANRQAKDGRPVFRYSEFPRDHRREPALLRLPASVLLSTGNARAAAGEILGEPDAASPDAAPALRFGELLRRLDQQPSIPPLPPRAARRILFATLADLYAGAEESFFLLISGLDRARYKPLVLLPNQSLLARKLSAAGIDVVCPGIDPHRVNPASLRWFERFLAEARPDLIHIDSFAFPSLVLPAWLAHTPILHHVRVLHGRNCPETYKFADRVVAISGAVHLDLLRNGIHPESLVTIPNGLDLEKFRPRSEDKAALRAQRGVPADAFVLAMAARISAEKRQHFVVSAMPEILKRIPEAVLVLAGETYEWQIGYRQELEKTISRLDLETRVRWLGYEPDPEIVYAMSDVTVLATEVEAFGRCLVESMAMEVPVIAPDRKGPLEIVTHRADGLLYRSTDSEDFVAQVTALYADPALYQRLAENGRRRAEEFSISRHVERIQSLYDGLLK
jgi:glycosyltransferase involved in cell wall biosynthesis